MHIRDRIKDFRRVPASELSPSPRNWRTHPEAQQEALRGVLAEIGIADAVLARELPDGRLELVDGHLRAETLPTEVLPVLVLDIDENEAAKLLLTLDPLAAMAKANTDRLNSLLRDVQTESQAVADLLTKLAEDNGVLSGGDKKVVEDEVPEPPAEPITRPGDLWRLGDHRLLCGDSTKAEDVASLMAGEKADLCFTSPPYNAATFGWSDAPKYDHDNDNKTQGDYESFLTKFTTLALEVADVAIVNIQQLSGNKLAFIEWLHTWRRHVVDIAIWDKTTAAPAMEPAVMSSAFEYLVILSPQLLPTRKVPHATWRGTVQNVHRAGKQTANSFAHTHRATFPLHVPEWGFNACDAARRVYEPFCGSGTTLIAAEQLGRKCYGMEISPAYCDVIVARWEALTGKKAEVEHGDG